MKMQFFKPENMKQWEIKNSLITSIVLKNDSCFGLHAKNRENINNICETINGEISITSQEGGKGVNFKKPVKDFSKNTITLEGNVIEIAETLTKYSLISSQELDSIFSYLEKTNEVKEDDLTEIETLEKSSESSPLIPKSIKL